MVQKILLVEDDFFISDLYKRQLILSGFEVETSGNGRDALDKVNQKPYDLILLDIIMPIMNGIETLRALKQNVTTKNIPVIILSNLAQDSIIEEAKKLGIVAYWTKDQMLPQQLIEKINELIPQLEKQQSNSS